MMDGICNCRHLFFLIILIITIDKLFVGVIHQDLPYNLIFPVIKQVNQLQLRSKRYYEMIVTICYLPEVSPRLFLPDQKSMQLHYMT